VKTLISLRAWQQDHGPESWKTLLKQIKPMWNARLNYTPQDFAKVIAPTLVLLGDRDGFVPVEEGVRMYRLLPNAELAVVPGADHMQFIFSPEKIAVVQPIILDFLQRHTTSD
jgi:pimeloyl-ACP methyl ester carboxylesterase